MIIGLTGYIGTGKTTIAARHLVETYGFTPINFKDPLINEIKGKFPLLLTAIATTLFPEYDPCISLNMIWQKPLHPLMRSLLQNYGSDVRRGDDERYWVRQHVSAVTNAYNKKLDIVTDDVRFLNEADSIRKFPHGYVVRLTRSGHESSGHVSELEQHLIAVDHTIPNDGTPADLRFAVGQFYASKLN